MKSDKIGAIISILGITIVNIHTWVGYRYPFIYDNTKTVVLWKNKAYKEPLTIAFYMYEIEQLIAWVVVLFGVWVAIRRKSIILCQVILILMLYFLTQICFYVYDRNSSEDSNNIVYIYIVVAFFYIFIPDKKQSKVIHF